MSAAVFGSSFANAVESKVHLHSGCHCLLLMTFDEDGMDFEDLEFGRQDEDSCPWDEEPQEASQLKPDEPLSTIEPAAMVVAEQIAVGATTPSKSSSSSCSRADVSLVPSPESSSSSTTATPVKKRRLRVKTTTDDILFVAPVQLPVVGGQHVVWEINEEEFDNKSHRNQYLFVYNKMRRNGPTPGSLEAPADARVGQAEDDHAMLEQGGAHGVTCRQAMRQFVDQSSPPQWMQTWAVKNLKVVPPAESKWLHAKSALLTWNGFWGVLLLDPQEDGIDQDIDRLVLRVQDSDAAQTLIKEFFDFVNLFVDEHHVSEWAASVEICGRTLASSGEVRLHCHAFVRKNQDKFNMRVPTSMVFKNSVPDRRAQNTGAKTRGTGSFAAMYYLQCPKIGMVASSGSKQPFIDYSVNGSWIFSLVQGLKMGYKTARNELIKTTQGLTRKLADLDKWHAEQGALNIEERVRARCTALQASMLPFRLIQIVEDWKVHIESLRMRKCFLVLEGPSGVAKTAYANSLWGSASTLELNMAGSDDFCLRQFNPAIHKAIVWDEARPNVVSSQRKLFQCGPSWVDLGQSPTGAHVYRVWLNDSAMIVCSNKWTELVNGMKHSDAEWIRANQVHVMVLSSLVA
jgi:hypothetical protein